MAETLNDTTSNDTAETLNDVTEELDELASPEVIGSMRGYLRGFYFNVLSWNAYSRGGATDMLAAGDAAITTLTPARDAIHYYQLIVRGAEGVMRNAPLLERIYLPPASGAKFDAVGGVRASLRDGSLARIINASSKDLKVVAARRGRSEAKMEPLFEYNTLREDTKVHKEGAIYENDRKTINHIMQQQMNALKAALFAEFKGGYLFPHLNLLVVNFDAGQFDELFFDPLEPERVSMRAEPILRSLKVNREQQAASFANEGMFVIKKVVIKVKTLWEKYATNSSFSGTSLTYWSQGGQGEARNAVPAVTLENALVFAIPADFANGTYAERAKAVFNVLVGIKGGENILFITPSIERGAVISAELLEITSTWPEFYVIRPAVTPNLDLKTTSGGIDDPANFKPITKFVQ
jgi:hypothetical protein